MFRWFLPYRIDSCKTADGPSYRRHYLSGPDTEDEAQGLELVGLWLLFERMLECYSHRMKP